MPKAKCTPKRKGASKPAKAPADSAGCYPLGTVKRSGGIDWVSKNVTRNGKRYRQWVRVPTSGGARSSTTKRTAKTPSTPPRMAAAQGLWSDTGRDGRPYELRKSPDGKRYRWYLLKDGAMAGPAGPVAGAMGPDPNWQRYVKANAPGYCKDPTRGRVGSTARPIIAPGCVKRGVMLAGQAPGTYWKAGVDSANRARWIKMEDAMVKPASRNGKPARKPLLGGVNYDLQPYELRAMRAAAEAGPDPDVLPLVSTSAAPGERKGPSDVEMEAFANYLVDAGLRVTGKALTSPAVLQKLGDPAMAGGVGTVDNLDKPKYITDGYNWYAVVQESP